MDLVTRLNAALAGRYVIERLLGEGGMATVYLAKDLRHNRLVALKVLRPDLAAALGAERFLAEVNTTANLQHPHILPLHDSGQADVFLYYTMPYVDGETLRQRLDRERQLPEEEAVKIATDIADALQLAHERGVIHRDVKPSNILLSRGKALVADFGIAYVAGAAESTRMTQSGMSLGTIGYMSPEQACGDPALDHRSDVYSLGCVLFEMLAGELPYGGGTPLEVLAKQATGQVPSVCAKRPEISGGFDRVFSAALAKDPANRLESAVAFIAALAARRDANAAASAAPSAPTVVVLPFVNRSADADNEYFSDGLTDEVITDLSRVSALRVISRNSAMALKGTTKNTAALARELGVTHLVTGTVRRAGSSLRITAELVDACTDTPVWSEKFSGSMEDVFGIQEDISSQIVAALKVRLTPSEERDVKERPFDDPVAYDAYLRASHLMYTWTPDSQRRAVRLVDEAIEIAGDVPLLLAMKGQLHWNTVNMSLDPSPTALEEADALANRALALDPDCYLAIFVRGLVAGTRGQPEIGLVDLYRAHHLRPGDGNVLVEVGRFSLAAGLRRWQATGDQLVAIEPLSPQSHLLVGLYHWLHGPRREAARHASRAIELAPEPSMLHIGAAWCMAAAGQRTEAATILARVSAAAPDVVAALATFLDCALRLDEAGASRVMTPEIEQAVTNEFFCLMMAQGHALLGRRDAAIRTLRAAIRLGFINYPGLTAEGSYLESLNSSPAFQALVTEVRPRWERVVSWESGRS